MAAEYATWDERVAAERTDAEPGRIDAFIGAQLTSDAKSGPQAQLRGA